MEAYHLEQRARTVFHSKAWISIHPLCFHGFSNPGLWPTIQWYLPLGARRTVIPKAPVAKAAPNRPAPKAKPAAKPACAKAAAKSEPAATPKRNSGGAPKPAPKRQRKWDRSTVVCSLGFDCWIFSSKGSGRGKAEHNCHIDFSSAIFFPKKQNGWALRHSKKQPRKPLHLHWFFFGIFEVVDIPLYEHQGRPHQWTIQIIRLIGPFCPCQVRVHPKEERWNFWLIK